MNKKDLQRAYVIIGEIVAIISPPDEGGWLYAPKYSDKYWHNLLCAFKYNLISAQGFEQMDNWPKLFTDTKESRNPHWHSALRQLRNHPVHGVKLYEILNNR